MRYTIASDIPGRISLRFGAYTIDADEARGIAVALMRIEGVSYAEAHERNGSLVVVYETARRAKGNRTRVLAALDRLDPYDLPALAEDSVEVPTELQIALENNRFAVEMSTMVVKRIAWRLLVPAPLRIVRTIFRAIGFIWKGLRTLVRGKLTVDVLDATAIAVSLARGRFSDASSVMFLLRLTGLLEDHVQRRVRLALAESLITRPETVWAILDGEEVSIPIAQVVEGQTLHLGSGQVLPVDGVVVEGTGEINEASMTGEAALVAKERDSMVYAGTALETGDLYVRVVGAPGKARIDQIAAMVEDSSVFKAEAQSNAERLADSLVPVSFASFFGLLAITRSLATATAVLMVDYSCAVRLSTPICIMTAMSEAQKRNIVVKGGKYLEAFAKADTIVFDKTGTLTHAQPSVSKILTFGDMHENDVLRYAACIEEHFPHSVARAIVEASRARGLDHKSELHAKVDYVVAHGIKTKIDGHTTYIGSQHFVFEDEKAKKPRGFAARMRAEAASSSIVYFALDGKLEAAICIDDPLRDEARAVLDELRGLGIEKVVMLTGDSEACASAVADELSLDEYHAQVLPEQKSAFVEGLRADGHTVVMVGDGINDSPALAAADVSVALADASDIARAVADVAVLDASLESLVTLRRLSCALMNRIHGDYRLIVGVNTALIALGVSGAISITAASFLHNLSTLGIAAANTRGYR